MHLVDPPALIIGLIVLFYWGRVIRLVWKTRQKTGRAANFLPPEKLGAFLRIIWYPTVGAWILVPLFCAFRANRPAGFVPLFYSQVVAYVAVAVACVAMYYTLMCWRKMGKDWRMGIDPTEKNTLIISGPYSFVRHPIYALSSLLMIVSVIAVPTIVMIVVGVIHLSFLQWEARREERHMLSVHGETYADYMRQVGRFVPRGRFQQA